MCREIAGQTEKASRRNKERKESKRKEKGGEREKEREREREKKGRDEVKGKHVAAQSGIPFSYYMPSRNPAAVSRRDARLCEVDK